MLYDGERKTYAKLNAKTGGDGITLPQKVRKRVAMFCCKNFIQSDFLFETIRFLKYRQESTKIIIKLKIYRQIMLS
jgi:hypothetical protein